MDKLRLLAAHNKRLAKAMYLTNHLIKNNSISIYKELEQLSEEERELFHAEYPGYRTEQSIAN